MISGDLFIFVRERGGLWDGVGDCGSGFQDGFRFRWCGVLGHAIVALFIIVGLIILLLQSLEDGRFPVRIFPVGLRRVLSASVAFK